MAKKQQGSSNVALGDGEKVLVANRVHERSPSFFSVYVNDAQLQSTLWDFRLVVGSVEQSPDISDPTLRVQQLGEIKMSPQLAQRLSAILLAQLQGYQEIYGRIPTLPD